MNRVLVVDDEPQIRRALRTSLEAHGYEVQTVGTGEEAVIGAAESAPELMLLDLGLPDLDGTEVIRRVRGFTELPIIVLYTVITNLNFFKGQKKWIVICLSILSISLSFWLASYIQDLLVRSYF